MPGGSRLTLSKYITGVLIKGLSRAIQGLNKFKGERKGSTDCSDIAVRVGPKIPGESRLNSDIFKNFIFQRKLSFLGKIKNYTLGEILDFHQFTLNMILKIFMKIAI